MVTDLNLIQQHFFGRIRQACGANDKPTPKQFIQVYRLLSFASLIKPPRGSNVTGGEMLQSLTSFKDALEDPDAERRQKLEEEVDRILDKGDEDALIEKHMFSLDPNDYKETVAVDDPASHSYHINRKINPYAFQFFGGYVARKARQFSAAKNCEACFKTLIRQSTEAPVETQYLIDKKSRGFLMKASAALYNFLVKLENTILSVINRKKISKHILWEGT